MYIYDGGNGIGEKQMDGMSRAKLGRRAQDGQNHVSDPLTSRTMA